MAEVIDNLFDYLTFGVIPASLPLKTLMSGAMNFLWASLNDLSFLTLLSLVSLTVPGLAHSLQ